MQSGESKEYRVGLVMESQGKSDLKFKTQGQWRPLEKLFLAYRNQLFLHFYIPQNLRLYFIFHLTETQTLSYF